MVEVEFYNLSRSNDNVIYLSVHLFDDFKLVCSFISFSFSYIYNFVFIYFPKIRMVDPRSKILLLNEKRLTMLKQYLPTIIMFVY